jgi:hypothetical protein
VVASRLITLYHPDITIAGDNKPANVVLHLDFTVMANAKDHPEITLAGDIQRCA